MSPLCDVLERIHSLVSQTLLCTSAWLFTDIGKLLNLPEHLFICKVGIITTLHHKTLMTNKNGSSRKAFSIMLDNLVNT